MKKFITVLFTFTFLFSAFAERSIVQNIQASAGRGGKINVFWTLPENPDSEIQELLIYRDTVPITSSLQLQKLEPLASLAPDITGYTDTVSDFSDYFYAVIVCTDEPFDLILASINSTVKGVHLNVKKTEIKEPEEEPDRLYEDGLSRELPLPYLDLVDGLSKSSSLVSSDITESTKRLGISSYKKIEKLSPYYFEEDLISPDTGDDYLLFDVLKNYFVQKKYDSSIKQLERLITANISDGTKNRATFYLGEAYYLQDKYKEAIKYFVRTEEQYPALSKKWLDSSLDLLKSR